jgi:hypothetical protein
MEALKGFTVLNFGLERRAARKPLKSLASLPVFKSETVRCLEGICDPGTQLDAYRQVRRRVCARVSEGDSPNCAR